MSDKEIAVKLIEIFYSQESTNYLEDFLFKYETILDKLKELKEK